jgi:hypothetical protein
MPKKPPLIKDGRGNKCPVCIHPNAEKVSKAIVEGRMTQDEIFDTYLADLKDNYAHEKSPGQRISYHTKNCLHKSAAVIANKQLEKHGIIVVDEFTEQLKLAKELRNAAVKLLTDPDTGEIDLSPHASEVRVHYWQTRDSIESAEITGLKLRGQRRKKIETLQVLLDKIDKERPTPYDEREIVSIKSVDPRSFALDAIRTCDTAIDKFARMGGLYKADQTNPNDIAIRAAQAIALVRWGVSLANCPETKAAHAKGQNISIEFALSTLDPIRTSEEDEKFYQEMAKQLTGEVAAE